MANRVPITVRLESFEGPLDLLLYLIQSHEMDISKVAISTITDQYLAYVRLMQELNFDIASEFLVMAATLVHWKSKALLPQEKSEDGAASDEDGELSQEDLIRQLLEHQRFRKAGEEIAQLPILGEDVFARPGAMKPPIEKVWREMDVTSIALGYQDMLVRARKRTTVLRKETVSLEEQIVKFADRLEFGKRAELRTLLSAVPTRPEVVVTFLATLELARLRKLRVYQEETYKEIYLELLESLKGFNLDLARGFDAPVTEVVDSTVRAAEEAAEAAADEAAASEALSVLPNEDAPSHEASATPA